MGRSGTSTIAAVVGALGASLGDNLMPAQHDNPKGFFEDLNIVGWNDQLLASLDLKWDTPTMPDLSAINAGVRATVHDAAVTYLRQNLEGASFWAFKDPRSARLLPFWQNVFRGVPVRDGYVIAVRHWSAVVESVCHRDGTPPDAALALWIQYTLSSVMYTNGRPRVFVSYDRLLADPHNQAVRIGRRLGMRIPPSAPLRRAMDNLVDVGLRHHAATSGPGRSFGNRRSLADQLFAICDKCSRDDGIGLLTVHHEAERLWTLAVKSGLVASSASRPNKSIDC